MVLHTCKPNIQEAETEGWQISDQSGVMILVNGFQFFQHVQVAIQISVNKIDFCIVFLKHFFVVSNSMSSYLCLDLFTSAQQHNPMRIHKCSQVDSNATLQESTVFASAQQRNPTGIYESWVGSPDLVMSDTCHLSTWDMEAGKSEVQGQSPTMQ